MPKRLLVFQHMSWEKPGRHLVRCARGFRTRLDVLEVWRCPMPDLRPYDGLIVLGGAPNVDEEDRYPFLREEKQAIDWFLAQDKAYLGFCLGHQLLVDVLGGKVSPNFAPSVGFIEGRLTKDGRAHPVFHGLPLSLPLFKWHSQAAFPPLPKGMSILATSADCQIEAVSLEGRPHVVGLQFDNYAAAVSDVKEWIEGDRRWLQELGVDTDILMKTARERENLIGAHFELLLGNFLKIIP
jgi:GMP synthase-like glutamine amidotransferase